MTNSDDRQKKDNEETKTSKTSKTFRTPTLLAIVGPTASGKSALALKIAQKYRGEIICADSRTIYKGMDIGTAKPSKADQKAVPHWGLDLIRPDEKYNVAQFKNYAESKISDIQNRGNLPILVGGTGLYVDSILFDYRFSRPSTERDERNPRHLKKNSQPSDTKVRPDALLIGLIVPKDELKNRIADRVDKMIQVGLVDEVKKVAGIYGWDSNALLAPAYKALREYLEDRIDLDSAKALFIKNDMELARRQKTWFKRNPHIQWFADGKQAFEYISGMF